MAHGFKCKHCGQQETPHTHGAQSSHEAEHQNGYKFRLETCPGFELNKRDDQRQKAYNSFESQRIAWDSERRQREAWGAYAAHMSTVRYNNMSPEEKEAARNGPRLLIIG